MATAVENEQVSPSTDDDIAGDATPKRKRPPIMPIIAAIVVIVGGIWAFNKWTFARSHESTDDAAVDGHIVPVLAKVGGYVQRVNVAENSHVAADSTLVVIDPAEYNVRLAAAEADLAAARAATGGSGQTGQAEAAVLSASSQQASLESQIEAARAADAKARADLARMKELAGKQIVSRQQLDAATAIAEASAASLQGLQRQASAAGAAVTNAHAGVRLATARLQAATAARDNAALQLAYTKITAPEAGIVSRKSVEPGQLVQPGQPVLTIVSDSGVWVTANFKETQLDQLRVGQEVDVEVDAYKGLTVKGKVESVSAATGSRFALLPPDNATGNFTKVVQRVPVRIAITKGLDKDHPLRPGMSVTVNVRTK
jgi:membrane fusion protein (multidrug efflux system)